MCVSLGSYLIRQPYTLSQSSAAWSSGLVMREYGVIDIDWKILFTEGLSPQLRLALTRESRESSSSWLAFVG